MKALSEKAQAYMNAQWGLDQSENQDDIYMFWNSGYNEIVAYLLVNAGAVEGICKNSREMILVAESVTAKEFEECVDEVMKDYKTFDCLECNAVNFIHVHHTEDFEKDGDCYSCLKRNFKKD